MSELVVIDVEKLPDYFRRSFKLVLSEVLEENIKPANEVMTKNQLADYLQCDVSKINRLMKKGLPFVKFGDTPRFYKSDVDKWLKEQK